MDLHPLAPSEPRESRGPQVALVTGANHGIGAATARALAAGVAKADAVVAAIRAGGGQAVATEADLSDAATVPRLFELAEAELGPVDILVNNASSWLADTFTNEPQDLVGYAAVRVSAPTRRDQAGPRAHRAAGRGRSRDRVPRVV